MHVPRSLVTFHTCLAVSLLSLAAFSAAAAQPVEAAPAQPAPAQPAPAATLRVYSRETVLDVNVTSADGKPVYGLNRADFLVREDGKPIVIRSFREHRADQSAAVSPYPPLPPGVFSNEGPPEAARPLAILLLDSLDTPIATQRILLNRLQEFVANMAPGTRTALFTLSGTGQLAVVQGFTSDPAAIQKALKAQKVQVPPLEDTGQDQAMDPSDPNRTSWAIGSAVDQQQQRDRDQRRMPLDLNMECNHAASRGQYAVAALAQIARFTSGMPGRKNLLWYTGAFPATMPSKQGDLCYDLRPEMLTATDMLIASRIVLYPIDPRALDILAKEGPDSRIVHIQAVEHLVMEHLAENTGGKPIYNTNDLGGAAAQALDAGANFYTISYTPPGSGFDAHLHNINIRVDQPGVDLVYRHGYVASPPNTTVSGKPIEKASPMQTAMMRGAPQPTQILLRVSVAPSQSAATEVPAGNTPDASLKPPFRRLTLSETIDLHNMQFTPADDGGYHGQFEYAVDVYDPATGKLINSSDMAARPTLPPEVYQSMLASGVKVRQDIVVPAKGDYILRVGVRDPTTNRVGALEFSTAAISTAALAAH